ncbi:MAG TPA: beta-propeller fold lactonase family protein [Terriglobales bacterium]|jgi:6-phosphogluconolactonase|nr:beta-propeller fold lactonase family protein [Terriglobales bacterium]
MRFRVFACLLSISLCGLLACSSNSSVATVSGTGTLYIAAQGDNSLTAYVVALGNGALTQLGSILSTGSSPFAMALSPARNALFVDNIVSQTVTSYAINSDGSLTAVSGTVKTGSMPMGMVIDPLGRFLFVANQASSTVSMFSISNTTLTEVSGSPFTTIPAGTTVATGPSAVAASASGNFLYVANTFTNTVSAYSISAAGLTPLGASPFAVGLAPSAVAVPPSGGFLYVANTGTNNISAFNICDKVVTTCADVNNPDGNLTPVTGSPFSDGGSPVAIAIDPAFDFLYVLDKQSNQISSYAYGTGNGVLTPLSVTPTVSTGLAPASFAIVSGTTGTNIGNTLTNPTDFVYVVNNESSTLSVYTLNTTTGALTPLGLAAQTAVNPTAVGAVN